MKTEEEMEDEKVVMLPILQTMKKHLLHLIEEGVPHDSHYGLCNVSMDCFNDLENHKKNTIFKAYLYEVNKRKRIFWNNNGEKGRRIKGGYNFFGFHWNPSDTKSRLKWLDKQIAIESK